MATIIEGNARDEGDVDGGKVGEKRTNRFHNMKSTLAEVMATCIAAQFHRFFVKNSGQQDSLTLCHQFVNQLVGTDLIRQGLVSHDRLSFSQTGFQSGNNRKRQLLQLCWGELSFLFSD